MGVEILLAQWVALLEFIAGLDPVLAQAYATIILAGFNSVFIAILVWDRLADKPKLEIKMEDKTEIVERVYARRYYPKVSVLNKGRKEAYNCRISVQVFNQKSGKKIEKYSLPEFDLKSGATNSFSYFGTLAFDGNFVARISAETHKSKANKIVEYEMRNNYDHIIFKGKTVQYLKFHLEGLFKKYRNEWDTEFLANELTNFSEPEIRKELIKKLEKIADGKALETIIDRLENDPSDIVRDRAAEALGNMDDKRAVDPLLECLKEGKACPMCASAIVKICDRECVNKLINILRDRNTPLPIRGAVAKSLGEIGEKIKDKTTDETIEKALIEALDDFDIIGIGEVIEALGKVGSEKALKKFRSSEYPLHDTLKEATERIQHRISVGGDNIEEK